MAVFEDEVKSGDRRRSLEALRDFLVECLTDVESKDAAPLARQLKLVLDELSGMPAGEASPVDDLSKRRSARRASAHVDGGAGASKQRGKRSG